MVGYKFKEIKAYIRFISAELNIKTKVKVKLIKDCSAIAIVDRNDGKNETKYVYIVYDSDKKKMYIPLNLFKIHFYLCVAHQFVNAWQIENNLNTDNFEAKLRSVELYTKFMALGS